MSKHRDAPYRSGGRQGLVAQRRQIALLSRLSISAKLTAEAQSLAISSAGQRRVLARWPPFCCVLATSFGLACATQIVLGEEFFSTRVRVCVWELLHVEEHTGCDRSIYFRECCICIRTLPVGYQVQVHSGL
jgi:hypothetical protein